MFVKRYGPSSQIIMYFSAISFINNKAKTKAYTGPTIVRY